MTPPTFLLDMRRRGAGRYIDHDYTHWLIRLGSAV